MDQSFLNDITKIVNILDKDNANPDVATDWINKNIDQLENKRFKFFLQKLINETNIKKKIYIVMKCIVTKNFMLF
jgi:hypothetical protein